jgi:hypothetical protein
MTKKPNKRFLNDLLSLIDPRDSMGLMPNQLDQAGLVMASPLLYPQNFAIANIQDCLPNTSIITGRAEAADMTCLSKSALGGGDF